MLSEDRKRLSRNYLLLIFFLIFLPAGLSGCHSGKKVKKESHVHAETLQSKRINTIDNRIVEEALAWMGTPYCYAGSDKCKGTDCSGMVLKIYEEIMGIKLPRNSRRQAEFCEEIDRKSVKEGDLVFFATGKDTNIISHVGIMIDNVRFVHASSKKGVIISEVTTPYYQRTFRMYGRVPL